MRRRSPRFVSRLLLACAISLLLYPLMLVAVASVNASPQATVAQFIGFTWKWQGMVLKNERYLSDAP